MAKVVITEFLDEGALPPARALHDVVYDPDLHSDRPRLLAALGAAEAVIVRNKTIVDEQLLEAAPRLRVVGRLGVGLDNIDLDSCVRRGVTVRPATGANVTAVAEYVIGALLVLRRGVFGATRQVVEGLWPRQALMGSELAEATMGLVGYGQTARAVAVRAAALGMRILAHDPFLAENASWSPATSVSLERLLEESDAVSLHVPLTESTRHLIANEAFGMMKPTALLVNTARGGVVDELALANALKEGRLGGAALDVFDEEPIGLVSREAFNGVENLILTPHVAGVTDEANTRVSAMTVEAVLEELAR